MLKLQLKILGKSVPPLSGYLNLFLCVFLNACHGVNKEIKSFDFEKSLNFFVLLRETDGIFASKNSDRNDT